MEDVSGYMLVMEDVFRCVLAMEDVSGYMMGHIDEYRCSFWE